jgi:hypothetical protein
MNDTNKLTTEEIDVWVASLPGITLSGPSMATLVCDGVTVTFLNSKPLLPC